MFADFDIQLYLVNYEDTIFFEGEEEAAADQINEMLHLINDQRIETDTVEQLEEAVRLTLYEWIEEPRLLELEFDDMDMFVRTVLENVREQEEDWNE
ncbi:MULTISPECIES: hypothetical protein [Idiomarina]|jgi:hypothetical protein|uniref:Uncharacterized protein n=2 Tax=Idiomarina baltica TaxID=190892 RepID=A0A348WLB4_9GAMM|nr:MULTISPECIES: hypothetical protein [Idiomarina]MAF75638.1 hypothetical protein [Idiomarinaceae bacterium]MEC8926203.1 hypothetical protein [Pseudomonadota bacterium]EAQ31312.1 hypothetical protein OS145_06262 [Idiomarina baltica OS145]KXS34817.1 MAG: hypothetical protein AWU56_1600 [Idiomarina sp. T82-3]MBL74371.1 hypothetical protein [Idiomarinaceae bacterium]|tara:strand:- start:938 stop:1228 length:291 start_codon:yes stop_codon:yes gene_type:complete